MTCYCSFLRLLVWIALVVVVAAAAEGTALADFDKVFDKFAGKIPETLVGWLLCHVHHDSVKRIEHFDKS